MSLYDYVEPDLPKLRMQSDLDSSVTAAIRSMGNNAAVAARLMAQPEYAGAKRSSVMRGIQRAAKAEREGTPTKSKYSRSITALAPEPASFTVTISGSLDGGSGGKATARQRELPPILLSAAQVRAALGEDSPEAVADALWRTAMGIYGADLVPAGDEGTDLILTDSKGAISTFFVGLMEDPAENTYTGTVESYATEQDFRRAKGTPDWANPAPRKQR